MPYGLTRPEHAYDAIFNDGLRKRSVNLGYLQPITAQDKAELPLLLAAEFKLVDVEVLDIVPA